MRNFRYMMATACLLTASAASAQNASSSYSCVVEYEARQGIQILQQPRLIEVEANSEAEAEARATAEASRNMPKIAAGVRIGCWQN